MRFSLLAAALMLFGVSGCVVHTHPAAYSTVEYRYYGAHPIPDGYGDGWCFLEYEHVHDFAPDYSAYTYRSGVYVYSQPTVIWYVGYHPIPSGGYCSLHGRHSHNYYPGSAFVNDYSWDRSQRVYVYRNAPPPPGRTVVVPPGAPPPPPGRTVVVPPGAPPPPPGRDTGYFPPPPGTYNPPPGHGGIPPGHGGTPPGQNDRPPPPGLINNPGNGGYGPPGHSGGPPGRGGDDDDRGNGRGRGHDRDDDHGAVGGRGGPPGNGNGQGQAPGKGQGKRDDDDKGGKGKGGPPPGRGR